MRRRWCCWPDDACARIIRRNVAREGTRALNNIMEALAEDTVGLDWDEGVVAVVNALSDARLAGRRIGRECDARIVDADGPGVT